MKKLRPTRFYSDKQEKSVAKTVRGKQVSNSGATALTLIFEIYEKMNSGVNYKEVCKEYGIGQCWAYKIKRKEHWAFNDEQ